MNNNSNQKTLKPKYPDQAYLQSFKKPYTKKNKYPDQAYLQSLKKPYIEKHQLKKKNKLNFVFVAGIAIVSIVAIIAPIGLSVSGTNKINNIINEQLAWESARKAKMVAEVKTTETFNNWFNDLILTSRENKDSFEVVMANLNDASIDRSTWFEVINLNGDEMKNLISVPNNLQFVESDSGTIEVLIPITWDHTQEYYLPSNSIFNELRLEWGGTEIRAKEDFESYINNLNLYGVLNNVDLQRVLNTEEGKAKVASAIEGGDKINIGNITVAPATANSNGFQITIPYSEKEVGTVAFLNDIVINNFLIESDISWNEDHQAAIRNIDGVRGASNQNQLRDAILRNGDSRNAFIQTINWPSNIGRYPALIGDLTVTGAGNNYTITAAFNFTTATPGHFGFRILVLQTQSFNPNL